MSASWKLVTTSNALVMPSSNALVPSSDDIFRNLASGVDNHPVASPHRVACLRVRRLWCTAVLSLSLFGLSGLAVSEMPMWRLKHYSDALHDGSAWKLRKTD